MTVIEAVFVGCLNRLPEGHPTGIFKQLIEHPLDVSYTGLTGDEHGDTKVHGGPEKAIHLYPADHYEVLAKGFPHLADRLVPGSLGENLSTRGLTESDVCIGDVFSGGVSDDPGFAVEASVLADRRPVRNRHRRRARHGGRLPGSWANGAVHQRQGDPGLVLRVWVGNNRTGDSLALVDGRPRVSRWPGCTQPTTICDRNRTNCARWRRRPV